MIEIVAAEKYKALLYFIQTMYTYYPDLDVYMPKHGMVEGKAMRKLMDSFSGYTYAIHGVFDGDFLIATED